MELEILQRENIVSNKRMMTQSRNLFQTVITLEYNAYTQYYHSMPGYKRETNSYNLSIKSNKRKL